MAYISRRRRTQFRRRTQRFVSKNKVGLVLSCLILLGALIGSCVYSLLTDDQLELLLSIRHTYEAPTNFITGCECVVSAVFWSLILLMALFLCGLTAFGWPIILIILFLFGFQIGVTDCYTYANNGFLSVALTVVLPFVISGAGVVIAAAESMRLSSIFSRQLLPSCARCGGIWHEFKQYILKYLICVVLAFLAAILKTVILIYL